MLNARWLIALVPALALGAAVVAAQEGPLAGERIALGREVFKDQGCYGCHAVGKFGTPIGPDLTHAGAKYSEEYVARWLQDPEAQRPSAHMPRLELTPRQVSLLAAFIASLK
jgi:mono/diheme cytochrome c family protein